jgi:transcriptional regulator with XRE-family HTH domain
MFSPMTPAQCRAARALLDVTQPQLAVMSGLGLSTVVDFERQRRAVSTEAAEAMQNALERAGIAFRKGAVEMAFPAGLSAPDNPFSRIHTGQKLRGKSRLASAQIRAGRALVRWTVTDLARETALGVNTIRRAELSDAQTAALTAANELAIRRALETAGVVFIEENGGGAGVRLRERQSAKSRAK